MNDFLDRNPFLRLFVWLALGIALCEFCGFSIIGSILLLSVGLVCVATTFVTHDVTRSYKFRHLFGIGVGCILIAFGAFWCHRFYTTHQLESNGFSGTYDVTLTSQPIEKERSIMCRVALNAFTDSARTIACNQNAILYFAKDSLAQQLQRGNRLLVSTNIALPQLAGNPEEFDYGNYLMHQGVCGTGYVPTGMWQKIGEKSRFSLLFLADRCRHHLLDVYRKMGLSGNEFGMLAALTLGYKDALTPELRESFSTTGASHVLAVSGLHVGIIYVVLTWLFSRLFGKSKNAQRWTSVCTIIVLWFYAFITGLSPSVMRSTVMFSFMALAGIIDRKSQTVNTIFLSAFILLLYQPTLLFDVGFQLSYSAVLSIVYFEPRIANWFYIKNRLVRWAWELTAVSLAAQIGTAPFSIYYFHQFPNYFLLSNFVVIPAATLIIYTALALFITSWIPYVGMAVAFLLNWILKSMYFLISCIENLPHALSVIWIDNWQLLLLYLAIFALGLCCWRLRFKYIVTCLSLFTAFFALQLTHKYAALHTNEIIVYNHSNTLFVNKIAPNENLVITSDTTLAERIAGDHWQKIGATVPQFGTDTALNSAVMWQNGRKILVMNQNLFRHKTCDAPLEVDYLIVGRHVFPSDNLFDFVQPKMLITSGDVYEKNSEKFRILAENSHCKFHAVRQQGALRITPDTSLLSESDNFAE